MLSFGPRQRCPISVSTLKDSCAPPVQSFTVIRRMQTFNLAVSSGLIPPHPPFLPLFGPSSASRRPAATRRSGTPPTAWSSCARCAHPGGCFTPEADMALEAGKDGARRVQKKTAIGGGAWSSCGRCAQPGACEAPEAGLALGAGKERGPRGPQEGEKRNEREWERERESEGGREPGSITSPVPFLGRPPSSSSSSGPATTRASPKRPA